MIERLNTLFIQILNMSLTGSIVILAVLLLRLLLKRAPKLFSYCLWAAVLFRLLCPVSYSAGFSLFSMFEAVSSPLGMMEYNPQSMMQLQEDNVLVSVTQNMNADQKIYTKNTYNKDTYAKDIYINEASSQPAKKGIADTDIFSANKENNTKWLITAAACLWILVMMILIFFNIWNLIKLNRNLKISSLDDANIYITPQIVSPFVIGVVRPKIYLPQNLTAKEKRYVLLHEQIHLERKDHIIKIFSFLALCLHWFNPLVWVAFFLSEKDMEMSCDEAVIRKIGNSVKKEYSSSLLSMASGASKRSIVTGAPLAFGEGDTASRIKNILRYSKPNPMVIKSTALFCAIAMTILLANPQKQTDAKSRNTNLHQNQTQEYTAVQDQTNAQDKTTIQNQTNAQDNSSALIHLSDFEKQLLPDGTVQSDRTFYALNVRNIKESKHVIDAFIEPLDTFPFQEGDEIPFAESCSFFINYSLNHIDYREVSFTQFANAVNRGGYYLPKSCLFGFSKGHIICAVLKSAYEPYGIYPMQPLSEPCAYENYLKSHGTDRFEKDYTLIASERMDISDCEGLETIEVYADEVENVIVFFKAADGRTLYMQDGSLSRAGWTNIYLGDLNGMPFILQVGIEDRLNYGEYRYQAYRLDEKGTPLMIASSDFSFHLGEGSNIIYDDDLFRKWTSLMVHYLKESQLLISTQDGKIRTEKISEANKYNYRTLNMMERAAELSANGGMIRFHNSWYSTRNLSENTLDWLSWYHHLSKTDQKAVSSIPHDLYDHSYEAITTTDAEISANES